MNRRLVALVFAFFLSASLVRGLTLQQQETNENAVKPSAAGLNMEDAQAVSDEIARLNERLTAEQKKENPATTVVELLGLDIALLEQQANLLERIERSQETPAIDEASLRTVQEQREAAHRALQEFQVQDVQAALGETEDIEGLRERIASEFEQPRREKAAELDRARTRLESLTHEASLLPKSRDTSRDALEGMEAALRAQREESAGAIPEDAQQQELQRLRLRYREHGVHHYRAQLAFLEQREPQLTSAIEWFRTEREVLAKELERLERADDAARALLQDRVAHDRAATRSQLESLRASLSQDLPGYQRLYREAQIGNLELDLAALDQANRGPWLESRAVSIENLQRKSHEELVRFRTIYDPGSDLPSPPVDEIAQTLDDLQASCDTGVYRTEIEELEEFLTEIEARQGQFLAQQGDVSENFALHIAEAKADFERAADSPDPPEGAWSTRADEWRALELSRSERLNELTGELKARIQRTREAIQLRREAHDDQRETIRLLRTENWSLRGQSQLDRASLEQAWQDLQQLPAFLIGIGQGCWSYLTTRSNLAALLGFLAASLVLLAIGFLLHRWTSRRIERLSKLDLEEAPVRNALTLVHLVRSLFSAAILLSGAYLATRILPDLGDAAHALIEGMAWILAGYWIGRRINRELFRPDPPERSVLSLAPEVARRFHGGLRFLLVFLLILAPLRLSLAAFDYPNAGAHELLKDVFDIVIGLGLIYLFFRKSQVRSLLPDGNHRAGVLVRSIVLALHPILVLFIPAMAVLSVLRYEILVGWVAGLAGTLLLIGLIGYMIYQAGCFGLDRWLGSMLTTNPDESRELATKRILAKFLLRVAVVLTCLWAVFTFGWLDLEDFAFLKTPLPFQGEGSPEDQITWWNILTAILILATFLLFDKRITLFLREIALPKTQLDRGAQYTIATLVGYVLSGIGTYLALKQVFHLENLGYLVAALGVGIGFGLQELVANFISGLTLLFERPIKVGDTVKVGDTEGEVTQIKIRATTVRTNDNIFILVPNRDLIAQNVINYTHRDSKLRLCLPIGVAYGSDTALVRKALLEVAEEHEQVRKYPEPVVFFQGFGDSSLDFQLRVWITDPAIRFDVWSDLNFGMDDALRKHEIEIPFPQRDLHLRSADGWPDRNPEGESGPES